MVTWSAVGSTRTRIIDWVSTLTLLPDAPNLPSLSDPRRRTVKGAPDTGTGAAVGAAVADAPGEAEAPGVAVGVVNEWPVMWMAASIAGRKKVTAPPAPERRKPTRTRATQRSRGIG
jgi:hypothetical protein